MRLATAAAALMLFLMPMTASAQEVPELDVSIDVDASAEQIVSGSNVTYTITVFNDGDAAPTFTVTNELPAETTFISCSSTGGGVCDGSGTSSSISFATLAANSTATITIVANVNCPVPDRTDIVDIAEIHPAVPDPDADEVENDSVTVTVLNPAPRVINLAANPSMLWPANHKLVNVAVTYEIEDNCGPIVVTLTVSSNEPINGTGDGDTSPDWQVVNEHLVRLRAERAGTGTGRTYTITVTATDSAGQSGSASVPVTVPHDQG